MYDQSDMTQASTVVQNIDQIVINPHYMKRTKDSDIALMHLQEKVQYTGELLFSQEQVHSIMQDSNFAKHIRGMG